MKGTRITVEQVLKMLAQGLTTKEILKDYLHLSKDDVTAVLLSTKGLFCFCASLKPIDEEQVYYHWNPKDHP